MRKIIRILFFVICLSVFVFSSYKIYDYFRDANESEKIKNNLIDEVLEKTFDKKIPINIDFSLLKQKNKDIVGWIYSEDTPINYPVVQSADNNYYLRRLINGEKNVAGSIFMDYRNNYNLEDKSAIIYGHNMKNDTMFGTLEEYKNQDYYEKHKNMYYFTSQKTYLVEFFSGYTTSANSNIYKLNDINDKNIQDFLNKSDFKSDVSVSIDDKIIILSTCSYDYKDARYVVLGVLREI